MYRLRFSRLALPTLLCAVVSASVVAHAEERALALELMLPAPITPPAGSEKPTSVEATEASEPPGVSMSQAPAPLGPLPGPFDTCTKSKAPILLQATMVATKTAQSRAVTTVDGVERIAHVGTKMAGLTVADIRPRLLILAGPRGYECLRPPRRQPVETTATRNGTPTTERPGVKTVVIGKPPKTRPTKPTRPTAESEPSEPDDKPIRRIGRNRYQIDGEYLDRQLQDLGQLSKQGRARLDARGVRITSVKPGGVFAQLGVSRGDVITAVNGQKVDSVFKIMTLYDELQSAPRINLEIERRGRRQTLEYLIDR